MNHLPINLDTFGFVQREKYDGVIVKNRCGRDFLYYALHYYYPNEFNPQINNPVDIEKRRLFGFLIHEWFAWTQLQFIDLHNFLESKSLKLVINNIEVKSFSKFIKTTLFSKINLTTR